MPFTVKAYADDSALSATFETAQETLAKAVEWKVVGQMRDVSISDGDKSYSIAELSALIASAGG